MAENLGQEGSSSNLLHFNSFPGCPLLVLTALWFPLLLHLSICRNGLPVSIPSPFLPSSGLAQLLPHGWTSLIHPSLLLPRAYSDTPALDLHFEPELHGGRGQQHTQACFACCFEAAVQADPDFMLLPPQSLECRDYRSTVPHPSLILCFDTIMGN